MIENANEENVNDKANASDAIKFTLSNPNDENISSNCIEIVNSNNINNIDPTEHHDHIKIKKIIDILRGPDLISIIFLILLYIIQGI